MGVLQSRFGALIAVTIAGIVLAQHPVAAMEHPASSRMASGNSVVGFGDSVAAGYGLSRAASWSPQHVRERYQDGGARCSATPQAYPCVLAGKLGDDVAASRNYAIQGATSKDVLDVEIPRTLKHMRNASTRAKVNAVTLTVGADDTSFSQCLKDEFRATDDRCIAGMLDDLRVSADRQAQLQDLQTNLQAMVSGITQAFPRARVFVTTYYNPVPGDVPAGGSACTMYAIPALEAFANSLSGANPIDIPSAVEAEVGMLADRESQFQHRFAVVSNFMIGKLNEMIANGVSGLSPVTAVSVDFTGHDLCAGDPWVFNFRVTHEASPLDFQLTSGARCNHPSRTKDTAEERISVPSVPIGPLGSLELTTNCLPHPTKRGQVAIAEAVVDASR